MKNTKDFYNKTASEWADKWYDDESLIPYIKEFFNYLPKKPRILDLCCGAGYESMRMKKLGADVVGLDFSEESIKIANERNSGISFVVEDMLNDYSYLGKFDGCVVIAGFVHIPNEKLSKALEKIDNVLNDNGFLFIVVKEGTGKNEKSSYATIDGEDYDRDFYLHTLEELKGYSSGKFDFVKELVFENASQWEYYIFKKCSTNK
ncbi:class I SAM-dependent methyltransferase [Clostridium tertium]